MYTFQNILAILYHIKCKLGLTDFKMRVKKHHKSKNYLKKKQVHAQYYKPFNLAVKSNMALLVIPRGEVKFDVSDIW